MTDLFQTHSPPIWDFFDPDLTNKIRDAANLLTFAKGQLIHNRGDRTASFSIIKSGAVQVGIFGEDGHFVMTTILRAGHCFGEYTLFADLPRTLDVIASEPTEILDVPQSRFLELYETEPNLSKALFSNHLKGTQRLLELLDASRTRPIRERTAKMIYSMASPSADGKTLECRQSDLAATLGVSRASLSTALKQLEELGLITLGYGEIALVDRGEMEAWVAHNCNQIG